MRSSAIGRGDFLHCRDSGSGSGDSRVRDRRFLSFGEEQAFLSKRFTPGRRLKRRPSGIVPDMEHAPFAEVSECRYRDRKTVHQRGCRLRISVLCKDLRSIDEKPLGQAMRNAPEEQARVFRAVKKTADTLPKQRPQSEEPHLSKRSWSMPACIRHLPTMKSTMSDTVLGLG